MQGATLCDTVLDAVRGADAAVIVTEWDELRDLASRGGARRDGAAADHRRAQPARPGRDAAAGFAYEGIGRPSSPFEGCRRRPSPSRGLELSGSDHPRGRPGDAPRRRRARASEGARADRGTSARRVPGRAARARRRRPHHRQLRARARRRCSRRSCRASARRSSRSPSRSRSDAGEALRSRPEHREETGPLYALNGDELHRRRPRARCWSAHEEHGGAATIVGRAARRRSSASSSSRTTIAIDGFPRGAAPAALGQLRASTSSTTRRSSACPSAATTSSRRSPSSRRRASCSRFRHEGLWITVNTPKDLSARRALRGASELRPTLARTASAVEPCPRTGPDGIESAMSVDSPNLEGSTPGRSSRGKVEKPWGYELIWAETEQYVGKVLFVKAGESLSLQFHREKDESWLVQAGRAKLELGSAGDAMLERGGDRGRRLLPLPAGHGPPRHRDRGHDHPRGLDAAARRRRPPRGRVRPARAPPRP